MGIFDFRRNKNITNENGLNEVYYDSGKSDQIREKYYKKNGQIDQFKEWYREDGTLEKKIEYSEGQVHGKTKRLILMVSWLGNPIIEMERRLI